MDKPVLNASGFKGVVILKDWMRWVDDKQYLGFYGGIYIYQDKEVLGFSVRGNDSNWMVRIQGEKTSINILGCQIRGIIESKEEPQIDCSYKIVS